MHTQKYIRFTCSDGETWDLPKSVIAKNRAEYYANKDNDTTFEEEFLFCINDSYEAIDWLQNNMNPEEYKDEMKQISRPRQVNFIDKFFDDDRREFTEVII